MQGYWWNARGVARLAATTGDVRVSIDYAGNDALSPQVADFDGQGIVEHRKLLTDPQ